GSRSSVVQSPVRRQLSWWAAPRGDHRRKSDALLLKVRSALDKRCVSLTESSLAQRFFCHRSREAIHHDDKTLLEHEVSGLRALCLYPGHAVRSVPLRSDRRAQECRRRSGPSKG